MNISNAIKQYLQQTNKRNTLNQGIEKGQISFTLKENEVHIKLTD